MSSYNHFGCSYCGGPFNGGNYPGCSSVGFGNEFVYDPNSYSDNDSPNFFNHPPQPSTRHTRASYVGTILTMVMIVHHGSRLSMSRNRVTIKIMYSDVHQPPEEISMDELKTMMQSYFEIMSQRLEQAAQKEQELLEQEQESDELIKSSVENLVPNPSESEDLSDIESECNVPVCDDFTTVSNPLFDADNNFSSCDDKSSCDEDVPKENFKIFSNPLSDEEIISTKIDLRINEADLDPVKEICLVEKLLYGNSSPRPSKEFNSKNLDAIIESFSLSPIPIEDSDSFIEEISLFLTPNDSMPPGIENDDYESEGDILFLEDLLSNNSPLLL
nr:hypothetical protein [Tanacetum cinerariifolium]